MTGIEGKELVQDNRDCSTWAFQASTQPADPTAQHSEDHISIETLGPIQNELSMRLSITR